MGFEWQKGKKGSVIFGKRGERVKDEKKRGDG
jgi:hypothetical protein